VASQPSAPNPQGGMAPTTNVLTSGQLARGLKKIPRNDSHMGISDRVSHLL
jgi:hypothetical protein